MGGQYWKFDQDFQQLPHPDPVIGIATPVRPRPISPPGRCPAHGAPARCNPGGTPEPVQGATTDDRGLRCSTPASR